MTTGHPPFAGDSAVAIAYKHVQENPLPPRRYDPALPETLEAITLKCLAKNPANRYPGAQDLRADLRRFLDGSRIMAEPVLAPPIDPGATSMMAHTQYGDQTALVAGPVGYQPPGEYDDYDDYYDDEEEEPKRSKWFLAALILLLLVLAGLLFLLASNFSGNDDPTSRMVTVPGRRRPGRHRGHPGAGGRGLRGRHRVRQRPRAGQPGHRAGSRGRRRRRRGLDGHAHGQPGPRARGRARRRRHDPERGEPDPHRGRVSS